MANEAIKTFITSLLIICRPTATITILLRVLYKMHSLIAELKHVFLVYQAELVNETFQHQLAALFGVGCVSMATGGRRKPSGGQYRATAA